MKKILLINPPYNFDETPSPPYGLTSLAGYLIQNGFEVKIEDYVISKYSIEKVKKTISSFKPDIVGSTAVTMTVNKALSILKDYKDIDPKITTLMGGPHVTFDAEKMLQLNPYIDLIVRGEGEITTVELFKGKMNLKNIDGISYRENGDIIHNKNRSFIEDINILPYPARELIEVNKYIALGLPLTMTTSRGCPFKCIFCVGSKMVGHKVRYFSIERVVNEFEMLAKLKPSQINISDDLFTSNKKRCISICEEIVNRGIKQKWSAFARVDTLSDELVSALKKSGCDTLCFGIESGNQEILDRVKKKTNLKMCRKAIDLCNDHDVLPMTAYILGLPGETPETVKKTLEFSRKLSPSFGYHILAPFPGTEVREKADEYKIKILTDDWDQYDANRSVSESYDLPHEEVDRIVGDFNSRIKSYTKTLFQNYYDNKKLNEDELKTIDRINKLEFIRQLIFNNIIENFKINLSEDAADIKSRFIKYLSQNEKFTKFKDEFILREVNNLIDRNLITTKRTDSALSYIWR